MLRRDVNRHRNVLFPRKRGSKMFILERHSIRVVMLQFSFSNGSIIPPSIRHRRPETPADSAVRKNGVNGKMVIEETHKCSVAEFVEELEAADYELVDAFYQERLHKRAELGIFHATRYTYARKELDEAPEPFKTYRDRLRAELRLITHGAMWRVRGYVNPFIDAATNKEMPGQYALNINFEARMPFLQRDGSPVIERPKDAGGQYLSDVPVPIVPEYGLRIEGEVVNLVRM